MDHKKIIVACCFSLVLFSCERTNVFDSMDTNTERMMVEFTKAAEDNSLALEYSASDVDVELTELRFMSRSKVDKDATVKIIPNDAAVADYNTANGTSYTALPASSYSIITSEIRLTSGERAKMVKIRLNPSFLLGGDYAIGLSISEAAGAEISPIHKTIVIAISVKNKYDGVYKLKGYATIPGTPYIGSFSTECADEILLVTSGLNSVSIESQVFYNSSTGGLTAFNNILPNFVFDLTTNKVTNVTPLPGSLAMVFPQDITYDSRYDPATKAVYIRYGISSLTSGRYVIDTLEFCRPR